MRVLILANNDVGLYKFRKELLCELLVPGSIIKDRRAEPCEVYLSLPYGDFVPELVEMGCKFIDTPIERRGTNFVQELKLCKRYKKMLREVKPDVVFSYTIKPNIYGGMACKSLKVPCIMNITGLGTAIENGGLMQKIMLFLYRLAIPGAKKVFFQNSGNEQFFSEHKLANGKHGLLPGSGVNLERYSVMEYPPESTTEFVFVSRIMKEKGIDNYLEAASAIRKKYPQTKFHICGFCEPDYDGKLQEYIDDGTVIYHGMLRDVKPILQQSHAVVLPSYHEGMSNTLLEAAAVGRPILASNVHGCKETFDEGVSGFGFEVKNTSSLIECIEKFLALSHTEKKEMGIAGRAKMEKEFDRNIIIKAYLDALNDL